MDQKSMGTQIRRLREKKAWTQEHLAAAANISVRTVQRAEDGTMSAETLTAISGALDVAVKDLSEALNSLRQIPVITPILYYRNPSTLDWLVTAFGFAITERHSSPDGSIMHAEFRVGENGLIMCGSPMPTAGISTPELLGAITQCLNVRVADVDAHFKQAKAAQAQILSEPQNGYGHRRYQAKDPEGHLWYFATPLEDL